MAYDIFISYRRDGGQQIARPLKSELERRGYRVFLDFDELKDGVFDRRIMEAIAASPIFMVILSPHALDRCTNADDWLRREIEYASAHNRHFIPINPDRTFEGFPKKLDKSLQKKLEQHQFSDVMFGQLFIASVDKMVRERIDPLLQCAGCAIMRMETEKTRLKILSNADCRVLVDGEERAGIAAGRMEFIPLLAGEYWLQAISSESEISRKIVMNGHDRLERLEFALPKTYKIGDYYNETGKEGVVFETDTTGRHGKIVGMKQSETGLQWCTDEEYEQELTTDAIDRTDGMHNQRTIARIVGWHEKYPAFAWCAIQGEEWYLPAIEELETLLLNSATLNVVNRTLDRYKGTRLFDRGERNGAYWSSTGKRNDRWCSYNIFMFDGTPDYSGRYDTYSVRAVAAF